MTLVNRPAKRALPCPFPFVWGRSSESSTLSSPRRGGPPVPFPFCVGRIVGTLAPKPAAGGDPLRPRLRASLGSEEPVWTQERGALALGSAGTVEHAKADGALCLFEGRLYNGEE